MLTTLPETIQLGAMRGVRALHILLSHADTVQWTYTAPPQIQE